MYWSCLLLSMLLAILLQLPLVVSLLSPLMGLLLFLRWVCALPRLLRVTRTLQLHLLWLLLLHGRWVVRLRARRLMR